MLNQKQEKFINALITSSSITEACKAAEISRTTGYEYLNTASVSEKYERLQKQRNKLTLDYIQAQSYKALEYLSSILMNDEANTNERMKAAQVLLNQFSKSLKIEKRGEKFNLDSDFDFNL